jgi:hypothetical protein
MTFGIKIAWFDFIKRCADKPNGSVFVLWFLCG